MDMMIVNRGNKTYHNSFTNRCIAVIITAVTLGLNGAYAAEGCTDTEVSGMALKYSGDDKTEFIKMLYADYVFGGEDFAPIAHKYCTERMRKELADAYEYDCEDGECYSTWLFRSGVQDGPSDECRVTGITEQSDGWFLINFIDMGNGGNVRIKFVDVNGSFKIDKIDNQAYYM